MGQRIEIEEQCKGVRCVDLGESFPTSIYLQILASIQPRTSRLKFARSTRTDPPTFLESYFSAGCFPFETLSGSLFLVLYFIRRPRLAYWQLRREPINLIFVSFHSDLILFLTDILAFCEFSFGPDIFIITDPPGFRG